MCNNCKHCKNVTLINGIAWCQINKKEIPYPTFMGGKQCPCFEKVKRILGFNYPTKEEQGERK